jgi:hypothetical protein
MVTEDPPARGPELGRTALMVPAGTAIGAVAIWFTGWVQPPEMGALPLTDALRVALAVVETDTDVAPELFAVNEPVITPGESSGIGAVGVAGTAVEGMVNVTGKVEGVAPDADTVPVIVPEKVSPLIRF